MSSLLNEAHPLDETIASHVPGRGRRTHLRRLAADIAYIALVTSGWMAFNILGALGCAVALFIVLSAGQWDAFFLQLDNLASRYVAADVSRRWMFEHDLAQAFMLVVTIITVARAPGFIRQVRMELAKAPRA